MKIITKSQSAVLALAASLLASAAQAGVSGTLPDVDGKPFPANEGPGVSLNACTNPGDELCGGFADFVVPDDSGHFSFSGSYEPGSYQVSRDHH